MDKTDPLEDLPRRKARNEELPSDDEDDDFEDIDDEIDGQSFSGKADSSKANEVKPDLPKWLQTKTFNLFHDDLVTITTEAEEGVTSDCLPMLLGTDTQGLPLNSHGIPHLRRAQHATFLSNSLGNLPAAFKLMDASRPWIFYWAFAGLTSLEQDVSGYKERLMETLRPLQNPTGGFGGGHGQYSHCAGTYACVLALAIVDGLEMIDREAMWHWLGSVKQSDGGFCMAFGGEEDIRGAYCAMTVITLLNLPLELPPEAPAAKAGLRTFVDRLGEWIGRCQSFEGGIGGAPTNEAHGAYAFCALACLSIIDAPHRSIPKYLNIDALLSCLAGTQATPEGGFAGRANKLVDACYSHWVGGCWSLIQAALQGSTKTGSTHDLWNREGLIRYLLCCCQQPSSKGGMRDKPSVRPDAYHTCYSLSGLSAAQNHYTYHEDLLEDAASKRLTAAFRWTAESPSATEMAAWAFDKQDLVAFVHPVFAIPMEAVERTRLQFPNAGF